MLCFGITESLLLYLYKQCRVHRHLIVNQELTIKAPPGSDVGRQPVESHGRGPRGLRGYEYYQEDRSCERTSGEGIGRRTPGPSRVEASSTGCAEGGFAKPVPDPCQGEAGSRRPKRRRAYALISASFRDSCRPWLAGRRRIERGLAIRQGRHKARIGRPPDRMARPFPRDRSDQLSVTA